MAEKLSRKVYETDHCAFGGVYTEGERRKIAFAAKQHWTDAAARLCLLKLPQKYRIAQVANRGIHYDAEEADFERIRSQANCNHFVIII